MTEKLLVVDDKPANLLALRRLLQGVPAEVFEALSGEDALNLVLDHDFAMVLLDVDMPDMDGYEVAEMLRSFKKTQQLPIIFLTAAFQDQHHRLRAYKSGAVDYLEKPLDDTILLAKVGVFLELYRMRSTQEQSLAMLRRSEEKFRAMVDHVGIGMVRCHPVTGEIFETNQCFASMLEYRTPDELQGRTLADVSHPEDVHLGSDSIKFLIQKDIPLFKTEKRYLSKYGKIIWGRLTVSRIPFIYPEPGSLVVAIEDITDRKHIEERLAHETMLLKDSESRLKAVLESAVEGVIIIDTNGIIESANQSAHKMFGYELGELLGNNVTILIPESYREKHDNALRRYLETGVSRMIGTTQEVECQRRDGSLVPIALSISKISLEERSLLVGMMSDITDRKANESALLSAMKISEQANRSKGDFLANMSHEIRSPINAIMGMTELVLDTELTKEQRADLEIVQESSKNLLRIINDILDFSKLEAKKLNMEKVSFDLRGNLEESCSSVAVMAHKKGLELYLDIDRDTPETLIGDPQRLKQVLLNLLNNAIKFTKVGQIVVRVENGVQSDDDNINLIFSVCDTGIGIHPDKMSLVFERFSQADSSTTRKHGGTGLGLAICRQLSSMMGGELKATSKPGVGSTFTFSANFGICQRKLTGTSAGTDDRQHKPGHTYWEGVQMLLADQNETGRGIMKRFLTDLGANVDVVSESSDLVRALRQARIDNRVVDVILIDHGLLMHDRFDWETIYQTKENLTSVILLLPTVNPKQLLSGTDRWLYQVITKPVRLHTLLNTIDSSLGKTILESSRRTKKFKRACHAVTLRILLVDDLVNNQKLASTILRKAGHLVSIANNGEECLEQLKENQFDIILMDIQMPGMDGFETTRLIRNGISCGPSGAQVPVVAVTAFAMQGDEEKCLAVGMNGYVRKPYRVTELLASLEPFQEGGGQCQEAIRETIELESNSDPKQMAAMSKVLREDGYEHLKFLRASLEKAKAEWSLKEIGWFNITSASAGEIRIKVRSIRLKGAVELERWDYAMEVYTELEQEWREFISKSL